ncbi:serine/threonine-protein kinase [Symbioplanes lichenis]|uniref:serine/threonine-protein kinase n=1 Tax=Symbioplanes lichenis TaxID=1629072 RepID=UPI002739DABD|nr:serine/threonine-protein kinase [Actinoplanes lichenis]
MGTRDGRLRPEDPSQVGEYELVGRLGAGGMGVVYEARARDGRRVAVKVIRAGLSEDDGFRSRFRSEVARARQVPPFCTAEVLDADPDAAQPYLVVEFVDGPSLADEVARRGPLSAANLHGLAIGVATALAAIHEAGVIHRDLKPHNVLLAPGSPKPGVWRCSGPELQVKGVFAVEVTGHLDRAGSCLGIWFASTPAMRYRLDACADTWQLRAEEEASGDSTVLREWTVDSGALGTDIHPQLVVENDLVRVGNAGVRLGEQDLNEPELTGNWFDLGVVSRDGATGPFRVTFTGIEVRVAG